MQRNQRLLACPTFEEWTQGRSVSSLGTNAGAQALPFQSWRHFKEAFAPELVARAVAESKRTVKRCLDPFGGSGTTALACQFLGVHPVCIEVNPFLADLIEAKVSTYDADALARDFGLVMRQASTDCVDAAGSWQCLPATFVEPGVKGRWVFDHHVAVRIGALRAAIAALKNETHRRLFRVLLGGILIEVSNVVVNGKGRRYRQKWDQRSRNVAAVDELFCTSVQRAISEVHRYGRRRCASYELKRGDARVLLDDLPTCELAVFSPPYPNSFDYTDVYNVELWMLGYLTSGRSNEALRDATLCSHVQLDRDFPAAPRGSAVLDRVLRNLARHRDGLWDQRIPAMIGGYFGDMVRVLKRLRHRIARDGAAWIVVGDSRYVNIHVETARIIAQLAPQAGWDVQQLEPCRSMRASAQQGGRFELAETLIVLSRG